MSTKTAIAPTRVRRVRHLPVIVTGIVGLGLSVLAFLWARDWEQQEAESHFHRAAESRCAVLERTVEAHMLFLKSLEAFYVGSRHVERGEFRQFVTPFLSGSSCVQALAWVPRVPHERREAFEAAAADAGPAGLHITERREQGPMVPAAVRQEYCPVCYLEPIEGNRAALGFDLASEPTRRAAIQRCRDTGQAVASARVRLVQETGQQHGVLVLRPIYRKGAPTGTVADRRRNLEGFVLAAYRLGALLERALAGIGPDGVDVYLFDRPAGGPLQLLHHHPAAGAAGADGAGRLRGAAFRQGVHFARLLQFADRTWLVLCRPAAGAPGRGPGWQAWSLLLGGVAVTALLAGYFLVFVGRARKIQRLVDERTAELREARDGLELWIELRTADLQRANEKLQEEVAERKRAEAALRGAHGEMEQQLASISSILIGIDADGVVRRWNAAAAETFAAPAERMIGRPLGDCPVDWTQADPQHGAEGLARLGEPRRFRELRFTRPDGKQGFLDLTVNPVQGAGPARRGALLLGREITDQKTLESQLVQAQKLEAIGQLAAGIAHEINTPSQYVGDNTRFLKDGFASLLDVLGKQAALLEAAAEGRATDTLIREVREAVEAADLGYLTEEIPAAIQQSLEGLGRITRIVSAMKEFSHPGADTKTPVDVNRTIESTVTVARNEWKYVATMELDLDPALPAVCCLPSELNQVILNIVVNAADAIREATGEGADGTGTIRIRTRRDGPWAEIRISDTGRGIPAEIRDRVFDPFFTTKEVGKGTGQGLAIAHSVIVDKHDGTITVESEPGAGTCFVLRLPIREAEADAEAGPQATGTPPTPVLLAAEPQAARGPDCTGLRARAVRQPQHRRGQARRLDQLPDRGRRRHDLHRPPADSAEPGPARCGPGLRSVRSEET
jgi:PAS domain S-box-containing protein